MKAMGLEHYGGPEVLHWLQLPAPQITPDQVRVRVHAVAVNPNDAIVRSGHFGDTRGGAGLPAIPGIDLCGVIDQVGARVPAAAGLALGQRVVGITTPGGRTGSYAELVALPWQSVAPAPAALSDAQAASFLMNALTAWGSLRGLGVRPGETLAVTGAAGALGADLVQLAHRQGLRVIASASASDEQLVRGFGADVFVDRADGLAGFKAAAPQGVDAVADAANLHAAILPILKPNGRMAIYRPWHGARPPAGIRLWHNRVTDDARDVAAIRELVAMAGNGQLAIRVADVMPMDEAVAAHRRLAQGHLRGRLVLTL